MAEDNGPDPGPDAFEYEVKTGNFTLDTGLHVDQDGKKSWHIAGDRQPPQVGWERGRGCAYRRFLDDEVA